MATAPALRGEDILSQAVQARGEGRSQGTVIEQSRAIAEVQGALMVADRRPRDKMHALNEALESCRTREVAESAFFKFNRGGSSVSGETIHLARELARCWGNIVYAVVELDRDDGRAVSEMMAYAWDLETNARAQLQFLVPHFRDKKGGASRLTDMRDIYENNANMGARRLRECIFAVLPPYLAKAAAEQCHLTLQGGSDEKPLPVRIAEALTAFEAIGVGKDRIEARMGPVSKFTPVDYANLRVSYASIKRQEISADDEFPRIDALTGQALLEQAEDTPEPEAKPEPMKPAAKQAAEIPEGDGNNAEAMQGDDPHPGETKAAAIIAQIGGAISTLDVTSIVARAQSDIEAMPPELGVKIEVAADRRKKAIEAERQGAMV
jgi:hypothetical protein